MEFALELWKNFDDGLSGTGRCWDDIAHDGPTRTDIFGAESIEDLLARRARVDCCHHACLDTEGFMQHHSDRCQAICLYISSDQRPLAGTHGTAGVAQNVVTSRIRLVIDAINHIWYILTRCRDQHLLGSTMRNMHTGRFPCRHLPR